MQERSSGRRVRGESRPEGSSGNEWAGRGCGWQSSIGHSRVAIADV